MKQLNFNELLTNLSLNDGSAIITLNQLDPIELTTLYGTILQGLKSGNPSAAAAAVYLTPRLSKRKPIEKYQITAMHEALLPKLNFQVAPALSPNMQIQEAGIRTNAIKALHGLVDAMDDHQRNTTFDRLISFMGKKDMNVKQNTHASAASIDTLGKLVAVNKSIHTKLHLQQEKQLLTTLTNIDTEGKSEQPVLEATHRVLGALKPSFTPIHFNFHFMHHEETDSSNESQPLLKSLLPKAK